MKVGDIISGQITSATFSDGDDIRCNCEACEGDCSTPYLPAGTYITVRLDKDVAVGLFKLKIERLP